MNASDQKWQKKSQETRCRTASESTRERSLKIDKEIAQAGKIRLLKEVTRSKILIDDISISHPRPASYYISKAKESFNKRVSNTSSSFYSEDRSRVFGPMLSTQIVQTRSSFSSKDSRNFSKSKETKKKPLINEKPFSQMLPEWLVERPDYQLVVRKMTALDLNISEICGMAPAARSDEEKRSLFKWVSNLKFFEKIPSRVVKDTCDKLSRVRFSTNDLMIRKGDIGECMFIVFSGKAEVFLEENVSHGFVGPKQVIGEHALDTLKPRTATVVAVEPVVTFRLTKIDYDTILLNVKKLEKQKSTKLLLSIPYFRYWSYLKVQHLSNFLMKKSFAAGDVIYDKGEESDTFYIIKKGKVDIQAYVDIQHINRWPTGDKKWKIMEVNKKYIISITQLEKGSYFGESTLIEQSPRLYRVVCLNETVCLTINKDEFNDIFSPKDQDFLQEHCFIHVPKEQELQQKLVQEIKNKTLSVWNI
jgi:CRP-like cAMP-binding protein